MGSKLLFFVFYLTTLLFFCSKAMLQVFFVSFFSAFFGKIEKHLIIFCNFFSLCINDLEEI